MEMVPE
jgi:hypothetical protein